MKNRYHKRYIIAAVLLLAVIFLRFLTFGWISYDECTVSSYMESVGKNATLVLQQSWMMIIATLLLVGYSLFLNHKTVGKVLFFISMGTMILFEVIQGIGGPIQSLLLAFDHYAGRAGMEEMLQSMISSNVWSIVFSIFYIAVFVIMILNRARPHLAKVIAAASVFVCLINMKILPDFWTFRAIFIGQYPVPDMVRVILNYLYFFALIFGYMTIVLFDFQSRKRAALTPEEQLLALKENYEKGKIDVFSYEEQKEAIINQL